LDRPSSPVIRKDEIESMDPIATIIKWVGALPEGEEAAKGHLAGSQEEIEKGGLRSGRDTLFVLTLDEQQNGN